MNAIQQEIMARQLARSIIRLRDDARRYAAEADAAGKPREAAKFREQLARMEKLVKGSGLESKVAIATA